VLTPSLTSLNVLQNSVELTIQRYGLVATGQEDYYTPRKQYLFNRRGGDKLTEFFNQPMDNNKSIWLTPACIEDFLVFCAFNEGFKCVFIILEGDIRSLWTTDDDKAIEKLAQSEFSVYINPKLFLPSH